MTKHSLLEAFVISIGAMAAFFVLMLVIVFAVEYFMGNNAVGVTVPDNNGSITFRSSTLMDMRQGSYYQVYAYSDPATFDTVMVGSGVYNGGDITVDTSQYYDNKATVHCYIHLHGMDAIRAILNHL